MPCCLARNNVMCTLGHTLWLKDVGVRSDVVVECPKLDACENRGCGGVYSGGMFASEDGTRHEFAMPNVYEGDRVSGAKSLCEDCVVVPYANFVTTRLGDG